MSQVPSPSPVQPSPSPVQPSPSPVQPSPVPVQSTPENKGDTLILGVKWGVLAPGILERLAAAADTLSPLVGSSSGDEQPSPLDVVKEEDINRLLPGVDEDKRALWQVYARCILGLREVHKDEEDYQVPFGTVPRDFLQSLKGEEETIDTAAWEELLPHLRQDREVLTPAPCSDKVIGWMSALSLLFTCLGGARLSGMLPVPLARDEGGKWLAAFNGDKLQEFINENDLKFFGQYSIRLKGKKGGGKKAAFFI